MSLGSTLGHALGIVMGILIPGASKSTTNATAAVQQELADVFGEAAADLAAKLKLDTTGMTGPEKVFAITKAMVDAAKAQGFKGDLKILGDVALDVAQAAYRKAEPEIGAGIVALGTALSANPLAKVGVDVLAGFAQQLADKGLPKADKAATA